MCNCSVVFHLCPAGLRHLSCALFFLLSAPSLFSAELSTQVDAETGGWQVAWTVVGPDATPTASVAVTMDSGPIKTANVVLAPDASLPVCYLLMTDTSGSMKHQLRPHVIPVLDELIARKPPQHQIAIARFATDLEILAPFGSDRDTLTKTVNGLKLEGQRTELFRTALEGLKALAGCQGYRQVLVILSDGDAEDDPAAYQRADVAKAATTAGVPIYTLGFGDTIKLQILNRISEDTGGWLWPFNGGEINHAVHRLFASSDTGGRLLLPAAAMPEGASSATLEVTLADGSTLRRTLKLASRPDSPLNTKAEKPITFWRKSWFSIPAGYWLAGGIMALVLALLAASRSQRREPDSEPDEAPVAPAHPIATISSGEEVFVMDKHSITIGAIAGNDLVLNDATVSRHQAAIDFRDGEFHLTDRGSTNTSKVNGKTVRHQRLFSGDRLQFGEWSGVFQILDIQ